MELEASKMIISAKQNLVSKDNTIKWEISSAPTNNFPASTLGIDVQQH